MIANQLNLSMSNPKIVQAFAKQGDNGRIFKINLDDATEENGTLRIKRVDGEEYTSPAESTVSPTITDGMATFDSLEEAEVTDLKIALSPKQDLHGYDNPWPGGAGKNLLNNTASSSSPSGITFTVNADGTVTATGTATADAQFQIPFSGLSGDYYFCGCPSGGNASTKYDVYAWDNTVTARFKKWNGTTTSASDVGTYSLQEIKIPSGHSGFIVIRIKSGYAIQGSLVFKPMIVASSVTDNSYAPYSNICPIYPSNGKNLFAWDVDAVKALNTSGTWSGNTYTVCNVSFTLNADGTVKAKNIVSASGDATLGLPIDTSTLVGNYYYNSAVGGSDTTYDAYVWDVTANARVKEWNGSTASVNAYSNFEEIRLVSGHTTKMNVRVHSGKTVDIVFYPMICLPTATDTSYVPYQGINVYQQGKNLIDADTVWSAYRQDDGTFVNPLGTTHYSIPQSLVGKELTFSAKVKANSSSANCRVSASIGGSTKNGNLVNTTDSFTLTSLTITPTSTSDYVVLQSSGANGTYKKIQLEQGSTATPYEPYNGTTYPLSLGQSVYGGTLDVVSGKLTVTHAIEDLGALSWTKDSGSVRFYASLSLAKKPSTNDSVFNGISSVFVTTSLNYFGANKNEDGLMALSTGGALSARVISLMSGDATAFATAMSGQSVVYELATPTEVDLTPTQISTLLGENNVWSDGEITELTFEYDGILAELPQDATEIVGNQLGDVDFNGASTMPFILTIKKNHEVTT